MRGYLVRKHFKKEIIQAKEAGRQCKIRKVAIRI